MWLGFGLLLIKAVQGTLTVIVNSVYDVTRGKSIQLAIKKQRAVRMLVIVRAFNNEADIVECLDSLRRTRYANLDIIVADQGSTDNTIKLVKTYRQRYAKLHLKLQNTSGGTDVSLMKKALRKCPAADAVLLSTVTDTFDKRSFKNLNLHLQSHPQQTIVRLFPRFNVTPSFFGLSRVFSQLSGVQLQKAMCLLPGRLGHASGQLGRLEPLVVYRRPVLQKFVRGKRPAIKSGVCEAVIVCRPAPQTLRRFLAPPPHATSNYPLNLRRLVIGGLIVLESISLLVFGGYFIYLAVALHVTQPLLLAWTLGLAWLVFTVWGSTLYPLKTQLYLSLLAPMQTIVNLLFLPLKSLKLAALIAYG